MAAPTLGRALLGTPRVLGGPPLGLGGGRNRGRCSGGDPPGPPLSPGSPPSPGIPPEQGRLRAREQKERRLRLRREKEALGGNETRASPAPQKSWTPKPVLEYQHPLEPDGKKATGVPLPPSYSPRYVEAAWYQWWERLGVFRAPPPAEVPEGGGGVLSLVLPPPNVTGSLHLGHALTVTLQDALVRWRRMQGWGVLWVPGTDHAGIATQAVVERWLWQQRGLRRQDLSRSQFLEEVWNWKHRHGDEILRQLRALGASLDWDHYVFTMDPGFSRAVSEAFVRLFQAGLIRRQRRLVTWSCALRSALADIEVEPRALSGPTRLRVPGCPQPVTFGVLVTFAYPVEGGDGLELPVATTRPETLLGDVAVAVNPGDPRYTHLHGRHVRHPFTGQLLPIITDPSVDPARGTGALKVTPGHSRRDLALALAQGLPLLSVIGDDGTLCPPGGGWLQGVHRLLARDQVVAALAQRGLYRGCQDHPMTLPICSRSGDVVELLLKSQWFLSCQDMGTSARQAVASGRLQLVPKFHEKSWNHWMENVGDWCLSRQLWWGHRIPAFRVESWEGGDPPNPEGPRGVPPNEGGSPDPPQEELWVVGRDEAEARGAAAQRLRCPPGNIRLQQDPDVLDTWFSSALFPFAALGWPDQTPDLQRFYPLSLLETGSDLLFFWVARMVMLGQQLTGHLPFSKVLLHSLVRDSQGRKMSKSLGNVIDPCDVISGASLQELQEKLHRRILDPQELVVASKGQRHQFPQGIPECGADSLRLALCSHNVQGDDVRLDVATVLSYRRFCNKLWNALKFVLANVGPQGDLQPPQEMVPQEPMARWVLSRLAQAVAEFGKRMEALEVHGAVAAVHHFWLRSFCDVYLETAKRSLQDPSLASETRWTLLSCSDLGLKLLAPFAPFLAEELWQRLPLPHPRPPSLCLAPLPDADSLAPWLCPELEAEVAAMLDTARAARGLRETFRLGAARPPAALQHPAEAADWLPALGPAFQALAQVGPLRLLPPQVEPELGPGWVEAPGGAGTRIFLCLRGLVDPGATRAQLSARSRSLQRRLQALGGYQEGPGGHQEPRGYQEEPVGDQESRGSREELRGNREPDGSQKDSVGNQKFQGYQEKSGSYQEELRGYQKQPSGHQKLKGNQEELGGNQDSKGYQERPSGHQELPEPRRGPPNPQQVAILHSELARLAQALEALERLENPGDPLENSGGVSKIRGDPRNSIKTPQK